MEYPDCIYRSNDEYCNCGLVMDKPIMIFMGTKTYIAIPCETMLKRNLCPDGWR